MSWNDLGFELGDQVEFVDNDTYRKTQLPLAFTRQLILPSP